MGTFSIWHILILGGIALLLFGGRFKISDMMGDLGKGITSFRKGLADDNDSPRNLPPDTKADGTKKDT